MTAKNILVSIGLFFIVGNGASMLKDTFELKSTMIVSKDQDMNVLFCMDVPERKMIP
jgi:hypothetical protein